MEYELIFKTTVSEKGEIMQVELTHPVYYEDVQRLPKEVRDTFGRVFQAVLLTKEG